MPIPFIASNTFILTLSGIEPEPSSMPFSCELRHTGHLLALDDKSPGYVPARRIQVETQRDLHTVYDDIKWKMLCVTARKTQNGVRLVVCVGYRSAWSKRGRYLRSVQLRSLSARLQNAM